jgi:hypothetical protein
MRSMCRYLYVLATLFVLLSSISSSGSFSISVARLSQSAASGHKSLFIYPMVRSAGNVSTYLDQNHTLASTTFAAGSTVYARGEGWPSTANVNVSFLFGEVGEISLPITVSTSTVQTDMAGSFASSLKIAANGPAGTWTVLAEFSSTANSSIRFVVYLPKPNPPSLLIPYLIVILLIPIALVGFLYIRRRSEKANYYSSKGANQR